MILYTEEAEILLNTGICWSLHYIVGKDLYNRNLLVSMIFVFENLFQGVF